MPDVLALSKTTQNERNSNELFEQQYSINSHEYITDKPVTQKEEPEKKTVEKLSQLQIQAYSSVIENTIQNLQILGALGNSPNIPIDINYQTVEKKYGPSEYQLNHCDAPNVESSDMKFQKDRGYLERILTELLLEITSLKKITHFLKRLDEYNQSENESRELLKEARWNHKKLKELNHLLETSKTRIRANLNAKSQEVEKTAVAYEDLVYENEIKETYLDSWEKSRTYQNNFLVSQREEKLQDAIQTTLNDSRNEMRIHFEIEFYENELQNLRHIVFKFRKPLQDWLLDQLRLADHRIIYNCATKVHYFFDSSEYSQLIDVWTENYEKDIDNNEMALQVLKQKRTDQLEELKELEDKYNNREKDIKDYLSAREIRLEEEENMKKIITAVIKIQAWWRRLMRKLHLGPYRRKSKAKDKKEKKKKK